MLAIHTPRQKRSKITLLKSTINYYSKTFLKPQKTEKRIYNENKRSCE